MHNKIDLNICCDEIKETRKMTTIDEFDIQIKGAMYKDRDIRINKKFQPSLFD